MQHENVDKDPDLRKRNDLGPINRSWVPWVLAVVGAFFGLALVVLAGWFGVEMFGWTPGNSADSPKAATAGAWASAAGATALALASVWIAMQANKQARQAEESAKIEAGKSERRHKDAIDAAERRLKSQLGAAEEQNARDTEAAEIRHARELARADERLELQIRSEQRRETVRAVEAVGQAINRITEPSVMLTQRIDELVAGRPESSVQIVSDTYSVWALRVFDIKFVISNAKMIVDESDLRDRLMDIAVDIDQLQHLGRNIKNAAIDNGVASMNGHFTEDLVAIINKQEALSIATWQVFRPTSNKTQS